MRQTRRILALLVMAAVILFSMTSGVFAQQDSQIQEIRIIHTNDTHGRSQDNAAGNSGIFGFDRLKTLAEGTEEQPAADLILDAGDTFHGLSFATVDKGLSTAKVMNAVGYTATTPGNHDFNYTADYLKNTIGGQLDAEILSCNIVDKTTGKLYFDPYTIKEIPGEYGDDIKVGILGITSPDIYSATAPSNVENLEFADPVTYAQKAVSELKDQGCTVIIALAHMGNSTTLQWKSTEVAKQVSGIDLIIDGHTHVEEKHLVTKDNGEQTLVVQAGYYFSAAGEVTLKYDADQKKVVGLSTDDEKLYKATDTDRPEQDADIKALMDEISQEQSKILDEVVGHTDQELVYSWELIRCRQTNLGNVIGDAYIAATGADVAFENAGGIRSALSEGDITRGDIINVSPFGNYVVTKEISGLDLLDIIEKSLEIGRTNQEAWDKQNQEAWPSGSGSFLQWGGVKIVYRADKPEGQRVVSAEIQGQPIDIDKTYKVATNQYVGSSSTYPALAKAEVINEYSSCEEILTAYFSQSDWTKSLEEKYLQEYNEPDNPPTAPEEETVPPSEQPEGSSGTQVSDQTASEAQSLNPATGRIVHGVVITAVAVLFVAGMISAVTLVRGHKE
ncbi:MAG: bifunctional UDP-sugar hydrolase/5'-nucleotidase [Eubacterium sp.]|nr:bifunctional UDP-sugar hydrolase/5'-nucleotidase [Eubacterium sp.]